MNLRRVGVLLKREFIYGPKNVMFTFSILTPLALSLILSLLLGTLFAGKARLGVVDEGQSQLVAALDAEEYLIRRHYDSVADLKQDVEAGVLDVGMVFPTGFDAAIKTGARTTLDVFVWGESLIKHRTTVAVALTNQLIALTGREVPVDIVTTTLGDGEDVPWGERLFPFIVMMTLFFGGAMIPSSSLIEEKQKRTLRALVVTPASPGEVFLAKGLMGGLVSLVMGVVILALNNAFGAHPGLLLLVMALGTTMVVEFGLMLGALVKDMNTLMTVIKSSGILLYAPVFFYIFPEIPAWIAKIFPTYYMIDPIIALSMQGGGWSEIAVNVGILGALIVALGVVTALVIKKFAQSEAY